jgi:uncharacterized protein YyaL (SSP411 family)
VKREVVIAGDPKSEATRALLRELRGRFLPHTVSLLVDSDATRARLTRIFPTAGLMRPVDGLPTVYVCENYACKLPTTEVSKFAELLQ